MAMVHRDVGTDTDVWELIARDTPSIMVETFDVKHRKQCEDHKASE